MYFITSTPYNSVWQLCRFGESSKTERLKPHLTGPDRLWVFLIHCTICKLSCQTHFHALSLLVYKAWGEPDRPSMHTFVLNVSCWLWFLCRNDKIRPTQCMKACTVNSINRQMDKQTDSFFSDFSVKGRGPSCLCHGNSNGEGYHFGRTLGMLWMKTRRKQKNEQWVPYSLCLEKYRCWPSWLKWFSCCMYCKLSFAIHGYIISVSKTINVFDTPAHRLWINSREKTQETPSSNRERVLIVCSKVEDG